MFTPTLSRQPLAFLALILPVVLLTQPPETGAVNSTEVADTQPLGKLANISLTEFVSQLVNDSHYDRLFRPVPASGGPTRVTVSLKIDSFGPVNMINMEYAVELVLLMRWTDPRLRFAGHDGVLVLSQKADAVWKPGVFFRNAKDVVRHDLPSRNFLLWLWSNGTLQYNQKLNMRLHCHMDVRDFPFDTQTCAMDISVFEMHTEDQLLEWAESTASQEWEPGVAHINKDSSSLSQFFAPVVSFDSGSTYSDVTGRNFSFLSASFELKRKHSYYILYNYLPSTFIVLATWSSFAIDHKSPPARVSLSTVCFLAQITQSLALEAKLPRVSYVTTLGIWHISCIVFVYLSLLEYMLINLLRIRKERRKKRLLAQAARRSRTTSRDGPLLGAVVSSLHMQLETQPLQPEDSVRQTLTKLFHRKKSNWRLTPARLDLICLFLYPMLFGIFNIVYWSYCVPRNAITD